MYPRLLPLSLATYRDLVLERSVRTWSTKSVSVRGRRERKRCPLLSVPTDPLDQGPPLTGTIPVRVYALCGGGCAEMFVFCSGRVIWELRVATVN